MKQSAIYLIEKLKLQKHPEGGWFREIYRSGVVAGKDCLPVGFPGERNFSTSIYFLLEGDEFSAFHRIKSDEIWHFYAGTSAIEILSIQKGKLVKNKLGNNPEEDEQFQVIVPKNNWFAARLANPKGFALAGCTVSPGFDFNDFEMAGEELIDEFPALAEKITNLIIK